MYFVFCGAMYTDCMYLINGLIANYTSYNGITYFYYYYNYSYYFNYSYSCHNQCKHYRYRHLYRRLHQIETQHVSFQNITLDGKNVQFYTIYWINFIYCCKLSWPWANTFFISHNSLLRNFALYYIHFSKYRATRLEMNTTNMVIDSDSQRVEDAIDRIQCLKTICLCAFFLQLQQEFYCYTHDNNKCTVLLKCCYFFKEKLINSPSCLILPMLILQGCCSFNQIFLFEHLCVSWYFHLI